MCATPQAALALVFRDEPERAVKSAVLPVLRIPPPGSLGRSESSGHSSLSWRRSASRSIRPMGSGPSGCVAAPRWMPRFQPRTVRVFCCRMSLRVSIRARMWNCIRRSDAVYLCALVFLLYCIKLSIENNRSNARSPLLRCRACGIGNRFVSKGCISFIINKLFEMTHMENQTFDSLRRTIETSVKIMRFGAAIYRWG